ncbi:hypothetical protein [Mesorhizobium sp. 43Arga]
MMTRDKAEKKAERLAAEVRRQFGAEAMTRFLRTLPAFRIEADTHDRFRRLLDRLDRVEDGDARLRRQ